MRGPHRIAFKRLLADDRRRHAVRRPQGLAKKGRLPPVAVLEIWRATTTANWSPSRPCGRKRASARSSDRVAQGARAGGRHRGELGVGDRILARISELDDPSVGYRYEAEPIKRLPREKRRQLGIFRAHRKGGGIIEPVDRKELSAWSIAKGDEGGAKDGDLVRFDLARRDASTCRRRAWWKRWAIPTTSARSA